jgi:hypothetical protein
MLTEEQIAELIAIAHCSIEEVADAVLNRLHCDITFHPISFEMSELLLTYNKLTKHRHYAFIALHATLASSLNGWSEVSANDKAEDIHYAWFREEDADDSIAAEVVVARERCIRTLSDLRIGRAIRRWADMVYGPHVYESGPVRDYWRRIQADIDALYANTPEQYDFLSLCSNN